MSLAWMVIDFNSYFASVEQQENPDLRGKPVAVVPMMDVDSTCALAASYEAKKFGVKTGTNVAEARKMCPDLIFVEANHDLYVRWHNQLVGCIERCLHVDRAMSIDEVACELPKNMRTRETATELGRQIKRAIARECGEYLKCSIGIAPNAFLAKTASDMKKPDGLVVIERSELPRILHPLKLRDLCGIGARMEMRLRDHGIHTIEQLCALTQKELRYAWGSIDGERLWSLLRGEELALRETNTSTIGHSHVLPPEERNDVSARAVLNRLLQKAAMRLRHAKYLTTSMHLTLRYERGGRWGETIRFQETDDTLVLLRAFQKLWDERPTDTADHRPVAVGVSLHGLIHRENSTLSLFQDGPQREKLHAALDTLNMRYGKQTVYFAGAHEALKSAPMRIAFTHIPDLQSEGDE